MKRLATLAFAIVGFSAVAVLAQAQGPYHPGDPGVVTPVPVRLARPVYTEAARTQRIEGDVVLQAVIHADGSVGDIKVTKSLDRQYGLDESAIASMMQSEFKPGTRDGQPVDVQVNMTVEFRLNNLGLSLRGANGFEARPVLAAPIPPFNNKRSPTIPITIKLDGRM